MASIDHTCIYFHNGMLMKEISHCDWIERATAWEIAESGEVHVTNELVGTTNEINLLPFDTTRDGLFTKDANINIEDMNCIFANIYFKYKWQEKRAINLYYRDSYKAFEKYPKQDFENRIYYHKDDSKLILTQYTKDYCLTFYFNLDTEDSWVVYGGYGHYNDPYTHFYARGYGEEFEKKMAHELYNRICDDLLTELLDHCFSKTLKEDPDYYLGAAYTQFYKSLANMLRFKHYWSMLYTKEEREQYYDINSMEYDPESIFQEGKIIKAEPSEEFKRLVDAL